MFYTIYKWASCFYIKNKMLIFSFNEIFEFDKILMYGFELLTERKQKILWNFYRSVGI